MKSHYRSGRLVLIVALFVAISVASVGLSARLSSGGESGDARWISFGEESIPYTSPVLTALSSSAQGTTVEIRVPGMIVGDQNREGETYQVIELPGFRYTNEVGLPQIPAVRRMVMIPADAAVDVEIVESETTTLEGYRILPVQEMVREIDPEPAFAMDGAAYASDALYPGRVAEAGKPMLWRNLRVVILEVHPVRYNPARGTLEVAERIVVRINHQGTDLRNAARHDQTRYSPLVETSYRRSILNFGLMDLSPQNEQVDAGIDYLILVDPAYMTEIQPLADHHSANGMSVSVVSIETVGSDPTSIKNYIQTEYDSADPPDLDYVLLAGDEDAIELYSWSGNPSDSWYSFLEGDDYLADIGIGRLPAKSAADMTHVLNKILAYDQGSGGRDWQEKSVLVAHKQDYPGKYTQCKEEIREYVYEFDPPVFDTVYGGAGGTNNDVIAAIEEGRGIVNYRGHGDVTVWSSWDSGSSSFTVAMARGLQNDGMLPVVFSIACLNMALYSSSETIAEAFMFADYGAVAYLGATEPSYTVPNHDFDKFLYKAIYDKGITAIGYVLADANWELMELYGEGSYAETNIKMYLWLGDPALDFPVSALLAPSNLTAQADGIDTVHLAWNDRADNEDGYVVERKIGQGTFEELETLGENAESYTDTGLSEGTEVSYRVKAFNAEQGDSNYSNVAVTATLPLPPTDLYASMIYTNQIYITWKDNSSGEQGYIVERFEGADGTFEVLTSLPADAIGYTDGGMTECESFTYRVKAYNRGGESDYTNQASATTLPYGPSDLDAVAQSHEQVDLAWVDNSAGETGYRIFRKSGVTDNEFEMVAELGANAESYSDASLDESTCYVYQARAFNVSGNSVPSNDASATTLPAAPGDLVAAGASPSEIALTWQDLSAGEIGFRIERKGVQEAQFTRVGSVSSETTEFTDSGLVEGASFVYRVCAFTQEGESVPSNEANGMTLPAAPSDLQGFPLSKSRIELSWIDNSEGEQGFRLEVKRSGEDEFEVAAELDAETKGYVHSDLREGTTYIYRVCAFNDGGLSEYSNEEEATTMGEPPAGDDDDDDDDDAGCGCATTSGGGSAGLPVYLLAAALFLLYRVSFRKR